MRSHQLVPSNYHEKECISNYIRFTHCSTDLIWEPELREGNQLVSSLLDPETATKLLNGIKNSEIIQLHPLFSICQSRKDTTNVRIVCNREKLDLNLEGFTAAVDIIKQKLNIIAIYLNVVHRPDAKTFWKINWKYQLEYQSGSLSYTDTIDGSDVNRAMRIRTLLQTRLSPAADKLGLTFDFIDALGKSLTIKDSKHRCFYMIQPEFTWKNLCWQASDFYAKNLAKTAETAMVTVKALKQKLSHDTRKHISFFLDAQSICTLAITNKAAAKALDTPEAQQIFRKK